MHLLSLGDNVQVSQQRDYSMMGDDGRAAVERGLADAQWYQSPVARKRMKELMQRSDGPAIRDTVLWLGLMIVFAVAAVMLWSSWWCVPFLAAYGVLYGSASDSRWHEAGHGTAFKTRWMNTAVYQIACFMIVRNPTTWRWSHTRHHSDTIIVGRDPEIIGMRPPKLGSIALYFFGVLDLPRGLWAMVRHALGRISPDEASYTPESEHRKVFRDARIWTAIYIVVVTASIVWGSWLPVVLVGLPRMYGAWHHVLTGLTQHCGLEEDVTDHRLNSRTVYMNPISRFIYWNMNYHLEHHMYPLVPFHHLRELHDEIKHDLPPALPSIAAAYRQFVPVMFAQRADRSVCIHPQLPAPHNAEGTLNP